MYEYSDYDGYMEEQNRLERLYGEDRYDNECDRADDMMDEVE